MAKKNELSENQKLILKMLLEDYESVRTICHRLGKTRQAVYKTIRKLKDKGYLSQGYIGGYKGGLTKPMYPSKGGVDKHGIRLHGQEFNIKLIYKSEKYIKEYRKTQKKKGDTIFIDGNRIKLYSSSIELYANKNLSFIGKTPQESFSKSIHYWNKIFTKIENLLRVLIVKEGHNNIKQVNWHFAEMNNEMAEKCNELKKKIQIRGTKDGKVWFIIDDSMNLNEAETIHPQEAKSDMEKMQEYFNDIRDNNLPKISDMTRVLSCAVNMNKENAAGINSIIQLLKPKDPEQLHPAQTEIPSYIN